MTEMHRWRSGVHRRFRLTSRSYRKSWATVICANCWIQRRWTKWNRGLQSLEPEYHARHADGVHDLLLRLGDLSAEEIARDGAASPEIAASIDELVNARRAVRVRIAGERADLFQ